MEVEKAQNVLEKEMGVLYGNIHLYWPATEYLLSH